MEGSSFFISCRCFRAWFWQRVEGLRIHLRTKTYDRPFWFSCMKNSQLTIFTTKYGGDRFDDVPLLCTLCALSMFFEISSLEVLGTTLDNWFIKTDMVSDQGPLSACWYLMFLNIKIFLRDLFFSSSISLSNSLIVYWFADFLLTNCLLIFPLCSFISNFKLSISSLLLLALALASSAFFYICSILMYISLAVVSHVSSMKKFLTEIIKFFIEQRFNFI